MGKVHAIHGRDHCPGGADPIPCLGAWAWIRGQTVSILTGMGSYKNMFDNLLGTVTSASSDLSVLEPITDDTTQNGIDFLAPGVYLIDLMITWQTQTTLTWDPRITWSNTTLYPPSGFLGHVNEGARLLNNNGIYQRLHMVFTNDTQGRFEADTVQGSGSTQTIDEVLMKIYRLPAKLVADPTP